MDENCFAAMVWYMIIPQLTSRTYPATTGADGMLFEEHDDGSSQFMIA
jgi:hypothetical protein